MKAFEREASVFSALKHPARLAILEVLRNGEQCVCHMEAVLGYRQAYLSQHLKALRDAGLVGDRRDGWNIYYQVANPQVYELIETASALQGESLALRREALQASIASAACTCPKCSHEPEKACSPEEVQA